MIYVLNDSNNPFYNLALEEHIFNKASDDQQYLILWQNEPTVVIGKHQNTVEEINPSFIKERNVHVVRRLSGGGAVYHDLGNLNYTIIVKNSNVKLSDFKYFTKAVTEALQAMGVKAEFNGRNDLTIEGKKFSGNSQYIKGNTLLHHGTLLFNSNLDDLEMALHVSDDKIVSKGVKSIRSRVTNIREHMDRDISVLEFKALLFKSLLEGHESSQLELTEKDFEQINEKMNQRYLTWDWNYGESPEYNMKKSKRFDFGKIEVFLNIKQGIIQNCKFYGDFFSVKELSELEALLKGSKYEEQVLYSLLVNIDVNSFFAGITLEQLITCLTD